MPGENDEDLALARRSAAGDQAAFAALVDKHERPLRAFLTRMAGAQAADDIAQEAFLRAWRAAGQYDGRARFSTWLTRIAWRCRLDGLRKERQAEEVAEVPAIEGFDAPAVRDMVSRLSETERAALILCEGHGWTNVEAAALLEMPLGTLKSTVARARTKCRDMWMEDGRA